MATVPKRADEKLWYLKVHTAINIAPKKTDASKAHSKNVKGGKKGTHHSSVSKCDYVVVSDSLEGLALVVVKKPKAEPRDSADIPASNPEDPIDLESSPKPLVKTKIGKRKHVEVEAEAQPAKKVQKRKIGKRGNLDAFIAKPSPGTKAAEDEAEKVAEVENPKVEKPIDIEVESEKVVGPETADVDITQPKTPEVATCDPEKGKSIYEDPVPTSVSASAPVNIEKSPVGDQGSFSYDEENSPISPEETPEDYYYRTYSEKKAFEIHAPVWKLKIGDTFSDWWFCRDWLQGTFPLAEVKFQEDRSHDRSYHAYIEEATHFTSTTHRIVREWRSMYKEWSTVEASRKRAAEEEAQVALLRAKLKADQAKCEGDRKTEEWSPPVGKERQKLKPLFFQRSASVGEKFVRKIIMKRWVFTSRHLSETEEKLESSGTDRVTAESQVEPLKNDVFWLKDHGIISVANSVLNSDELDQMVAHLQTTARNDGYAQGYAECTQHVVTALKVDWDTSGSATHGVDTEAAHAAAKAEYNTLHLHVMDLVTVALQSEDFVTQLREVFSDGEDDDDDDDDEYLE
ncbi:hypothetical protein Hanom_Chr07g00621721 [Helianthus anomalus]